MDIKQEAQNIEAKAAAKVKGNLGLKVIVAVIAIGIIAAFFGGVFG